MYLLLIFLLPVLVLLLTSLSLLSTDTARAATTEWRGQGKVDVLLRVKSDDEGRNVDNLLANANVSLSYEDTGVVDRLGEPELVDASLETAFQEIFDLQGKNVIEFHSRVVEHTDTDQSTNEGIAFKKTLWVLLVKGKQLTAWRLAKLEMGIFKALGSRR
jgi:hypothetical protein